MCFFKLQSFGYISHSVVLCEEACRLGITSGAPHSSVGKMILVLTFRYYFMQITITEPYSFDSSFL